MTYEEYVVVCGEQSNAELTSCGVKGKYVVVRCGLQQHASLYLTSSERFVKLHDKNSVDSVFLIFK